MLYAAAAAVGIIDGSTQAVMTATVILSMALTPLLVDAAIRRIQPKPQESMDGVDVVESLTGRVLVVGFGRFGQIASQPLLLRGVDVSIIDNDIEMIKAAATFGFKVYYGDGTRLDILHAAGAGRAEAVLICVDKGEAAVMIAQHMIRPSSRWCRCWRAPTIAAFRWSSFGPASTTSCARPSNRPWPSAKRR